MARSKSKQWPRYFFRKETPYRPHVLDCGLNADGRRVRYAFATKEEAEGRAALLRIERKNEGNGGFRLLKFDQADAESAIDILKPHGASLRAAAEFYVANMSVLRNPKPIEEVIQEFLRFKAQDGLTLRHQKNVRLRLTAFAKDGRFAGKPIHEITHAQLDDWIRSKDDWAPVTRNGFRSNLVSLFGHALRRGYVLKNPAQQLETAKVKSVKPGILTVAEVEALLASAPGDLVAGIAIACFAGLRPESELWHLRWEAIDFENRLIDVSASKNLAGHRFVTIQPNLLAWLEKYARGSGAVVPINNTYYRRVKEARLAAAEALEATQIPADGLRTWCQDCMRHSYASFHVAAFKNAALTAEEMGHADGLRTFRRHYRNRVRPEQAAAFWQLVP